MSIPILATKLYSPTARPNLVHRPRLLARLHEGLHCKLTLISAPAGFGKTTLISAWLHQKDDGGRIKNEGLRLLHPPSATLYPFNVAWIALDADDSDPVRFLLYLVAAVQTLAPTVGVGVMAALQLPQPPPPEALLTTLINEITTLPEPFVLVLDDYHLVDGQAVDQALTFLIDHLPPQMHLVIATREDPPLPLARLRARGHLREVRAADLRFTPSEAAAFFNQIMGLDLAPEAINALEQRTEGWIAGLQLAALSLQGHDPNDIAGFIRSFTGSHRFVLDYLVEEVLQQQPPAIQTFLLRTSILERLCGPLCDAVLGKDEVESNSSLILAHLERANLFLIPLDNERRWYRYHHLFAELLRQRLHQSTTLTVGEAPVGEMPAGAVSVADGAVGAVAALHIRASQWYEAHELDLEAFHHAAAANDIARAERLMDGNGIPLHFRGAVLAILKWLESLPIALLNARPWLWWRHASLLLVNGHTTGVAEKLQAAEDALQSTEYDDRLGDKTRNFVGRIATARSVLALTRYDAETILIQAHRALTYLDADSRSARANVYWTLGFAYFLQGQRAAAAQAYREAIALGQAAGDIFATLLATIGLGDVLAAENQLPLAAQTFRHVLALAGDQPLQVINEAHLGLARILYEWNDLAGAEVHAQQSLQLARQYDRVIDRFILCEIFLAQLHLAKGEVADAAALVAQADASARRQNFVLRLPDVATAQVMILLRQQNFTAAAQVAQMYPLPLSQARVHLAQGNPAAALALVEPVYQQAAANGWVNEQLKALLLLALAYHAVGAQEQALQRLHEALLLAEPGGFIRRFVDEGAPMAALLTRLKAEDGRLKSYVQQLLAAFDPQADPPPSALIPSPLVEPLSPRELEVLHLIAQGLSNQEISEKLFLALSTVKGHNRLIFDKLQVQRRTEAVARARALGLV